ncbi:hypothetical protein T484DRAFT_1896855 [Baffinella frigidus]|nr:hypothetical protein T484DRAFT_1896855 [Cryptophyta sp. CCMP2293]
MPGYEEIYEWVDAVPLTRTRRNFGRDMSDGCMVAQIIHFFAPDIVDMHNYSESLSVARKRDNLEQEAPPFQDHARTDRRPLRSEAGRSRRAPGPNQDPPRRSPRGQAPRRGGQARGRKVAPETRAQAGEACRRKIAAKTRVEGTPCQGGSQTRACTAERSGATRGAGRTPGLQVPLARPPPTAKKGQGGQAPPRGRAR